MSQDKMQSGGSRTDTNALGHMAAPDVVDVLKRTNKALEKVRIVHGANNQYFDGISGKTVGSVRKAIKDTFNIPGDAVASIDGKEVGDEHILRGGQVLEFSKTAGTKGDCRPLLKINF